MKLVPAKGRILPHTSRIWGVSMIDNLLHHGSIQIFSQNGPFHIKQFAFRQRSLNGIEGGGADV